MNWLDEFKNKYSKDKSKSNYYYAIKNFLESVENFDEENLKNYLRKNLKNRKEISNLKRGFELIAEDNLADFDLNFIDIIHNSRKQKPKHKKKFEEQFKLRPVECSINRLKNKRLKLAYRLAIISGLRVSELADLEERDIEIINNKNLRIHVRHGKGNKERYVDCLHDKWVLDEIIDITPRNDKLFYSESYLMQKANKLNFHIHDLRKTFANIIYFNSLSSENERVEYLQQQLGHTLGTKTYKKYINRDVNLYKTRWNKIEPLELK